MPAGASTTDEGDSVVPDGSRPETGAELDPVGEDLDDFLHVVREMVHGEVTAPGRTADARHPVDTPSATTASSGPSRRMSRAERRAAKRAARQASRHERRLARIERRNLRRRRRHGGSPTPPVVVTATEPAEETAAQVSTAAGRVPAQATQSPEQRAGAHADPLPASAGGSRRDRRRRKRQDAARAIAVAVPTEPDPADAEPEEMVLAIGPTTSDDGRSRRPRRRGRRRLQPTAMAQPTTSPADADDVESGPDSDSPASGPVSGAGTGGGGGDDRARTRRPSRADRAFAKTVSKAAARGESREPRSEPETLSQYLARVEGSLLGRNRRSGPRAPGWRRTAGVVAVAIVIGACVALPWVAPSVPQKLADILPGGDAPAAVEDPPVGPPADAFVGPTGVEQRAGPLAGLRLAAAGPPLEVRVPRLHVDSDVVPISGQSGSLLPPSDPQVLGWWREGKVAGSQYGTAVVTGHTVHTGGGALDHLDALVIGDSVRVRTSAGWIRYVVDRTRIYATEDLARDAAGVFRLGGPGRLVLITCDDWNGTFYESNAVVFAIPVKDQPYVSDAENVVPDGGTAGEALDPSGNMERRRGVDTAVPLA